MLQSWKVRILKSFKGETLHTIINLSLRGHNYDARSHLESCQSYIGAETEKSTVKIASL